MRITDTSDLWWKTAVVYCLDVETYLDANGDGVGDERQVVAEEPAHRIVQPQHAVLDQPHDRQRGERLGAAGDRLAEREPHSQRPLARVLGGRH